MARNEYKPTGRRKHIGVGGTLLRATAGALIVLAGGFVFLTRTDTGRSTLVSIVERAVNSPDLRLSIGRLEGAVPFDMTVREVSIADSEGMWLAIDRAHFSWRPLALFSGVLDIQLIDADKVEVNRAPVSEEASATETASPGFPRLPLGVRLEELKVAEVFLGEALLGQSATLAINGSAELVDFRSGFNVDLAVNRIDGQAGQITGRFGYLPETHVLTVDIKAQEPAGGIVSRLAGIEELPPLSFTATGTGPLDDWRGNLSLDLAGKAGAEGSIFVTRDGVARVLSADIKADIAALMPSSVAPLTSGQTDITIETRFNDDGRVEITKAQLASAAARLEAHGLFEPETETVSATAHLKAGAPQVFAGLLSTPVSWSGAGLDLNIGGTLSALDISAELLASDVAAEGYSAKDIQLTLQAKGNGLITENTTRIDVVLDGNASGLTAPDANLSQALGEKFEINARGSVTQALVAKIDSGSVTLKPLSLSLSGIVDPDAAIGKVEVSKADLAALRAFTGSDIAGQAELNADIDFAFDLSRLAVTLKGDIDGLKTGVPQVDGLTGGKLALEGGINRTQDGSFGFKKFAVDGAYINLVADGSATPSAADIQAKLQIPDLNRLDPQLQGRGEAALSLTGSLKDLAAKAVLTVPKGQAMGRPVEALTLNIKAQDLLGATHGSLNLSGSVDGKAAKGNGYFARGLDNSAKLENIDFALGSVVIKGGLALEPNQLADGQFTLVAGNLADLEPLLLTRLGGQINLQAELSHSSGGQNARIGGSISQFSGFGASVQRARVDADGRDILRSPVLNANIGIENASVSGVNVSKATITANGSGQTNDVRLTGVVQGADIKASSQITVGETTSILINQAYISRGNRRLEMQPDARIDIQGGSIHISNLELRAGGGRLQVTGEAGDRFNVNTTIVNFPLAISELFVPDLGIAGTLSGEARVTGIAARPEGHYRLNVAGLTLPASANAGLRPFTIAANGTLGQGQITTDTTIHGQNNLTLRIQGFAPLGDGNIGLAVSGPIDLGIANAALSASGQTLTGMANVDLRVQGTISSPTVGGSVRIANGRFQDPMQGVFFDNIQAVITGNEREFIISSLTARTRNGGMVTGDGRVAVDPAAGFPGNITIRAQKAQLVTSEMVNMVSSLDLAITGPLAQSPLLSGSINVDNLQITIPDRFPLSLTPIPVQHIHPPPRIQGRLKREAEEAAQAAASKPFVMALDLTISAPSRVFVRGQGINAELGGTLKVRGDNNTPIVDGGFQMRRGTLAIVGRTLTFSRGEVSFDGGSLDPTLDLLAEAPASDVTAQIGVTGYASDPKIMISSSPELPRDEVFARLLFGKPVTSLSTSQTIRLAQAIAQLTGVGGGDALGNLGRSLGIDAIDIGADDGGNVGVGIGKRINDNIYLGLKQGIGEESSSVTVDVNITDHIKLQGEAGADGSSAVGVGMEWDY